MPTYNTMSTAEYTELSRELMNSIDSIILGSHTTFTNTTTSTTTFRHTDDSNSIGIRLPDEQPQRPPTDTGIRIFTRLLNPLPDAEIISSEVYNQPEIGEKIRRADTGKLVKAIPITDNNLRVGDIVIGLKKASENYRTYRYGTVWAVSNVGNKYEIHIVSPQKRYLNQLGNRVYKDCFGIIGSLYTKEEQKLIEELRGQVFIDKETPNDQSLSVKDAIHYPIASHPNRLIYLFKPQIRNIKYYDYPNSPNIVKNTNLPFPYHLIIKAGGSIYLYFIKEQDLIDSKGDLDPSFDKLLSVPLYVPPLPNIYGDSEHVCIKMVVKNSIKDTLNHLFNSIWDESEIRIHAIPASWEIDNTTGRYTFKEVIDEWKKSDLNKEELKVSRYSLSSFI